MFDLKCFPFTFKCSHTRLLVDKIRHSMNENDSSYFGNNGIGSKNSSKNKNPENPKKS